MCVFVCVKGDDLSLDGIGFTGCLWYRWKMTKSHQPPELSTENLFAFFFFLSQKTFHTSSDSFLFTTLTQEFRSERQEKAVSATTFGDARASLCVWNDTLGSEKPPASCTLSCKNVFLK